MDKGAITQVNPTLIIENVPADEEEELSLPVTPELSSQLAALNKRKEKARIAARARRSQEASIIMEMADELHITQEKIRRIDKATIVKLAIDYIKAFEILCRFRSNCGTNSKDNSCEKDDNDNSSIRRRNSISISCISQKCNSRNSENSCISKRNNYDLTNDNNDTYGGNITAATTTDNVKGISTISNCSNTRAGLNICISRDCDEARCNHNDGKPSNCIKTPIAAQQQQRHQQLQPLREHHEQQYQLTQNQITNPIDIVANRPRWDQGGVQPMPKLSTGSIFAPKTDDMDLYFLMINDSDGRPSFILKPDNEILEEDDLTHLAPQAGDSSISLEVEPLDGIVLDTSLFNSGSPPMKKAPLGPPHHSSLKMSGSGAKALIVDSCCIIGTAID